MDDITLDYLGDFDFNQTDNLRRMERFLLQQKRILEATPSIFSEKAMDRLLSYMWNPAPGNPATSSAITLARAAYATDHMLLITYAYGPSRSMRYVEVLGSQGDTLIVALWQQYAIEPERILRLEVRLYEFFVPPICVPGLGQQIDHQAGGHLRRTFAEREADHASYRTRFRQQLIGFEIGDFS